MKTQYLGSYFFQLQCLTKSQTINYRSFSFITKTPPASRLILKAAKVQKGSGEPNKNKVGFVSSKDLENIASIKMNDLNANTLDQAVEMIRGTCVSMGIEIKG